ncbi:hypothetical protein ACWCOT_04185 [Nonomuraea bangladeshensis]|uniref:hypothetical protein n=1 Tax=Nonomuraea bangladeshensis TaxID=404385 RepID=UPI003C2C45B7
MRVHIPALSLAALALLAGGCGSQSRARLSDAPSSTAASPSAAAVEVESEPTPAMPSPSDFTLSIRILEKECFGSAGCNLTYRIKPVYTGPDLADDQDLTVTYEVRGGEEEQINSFKMIGTEAEFDAEEFIQTRSAASKLKAKVTDVF